MDINQLLNFFGSGDILDIIFKTVAILLSVFYFLFSLVLAKQVRVMGKTLDSKFNQLIYAVSSIQIAAALILLIFAVFLI